MAIDAVTRPRQAILIHGWDDDPEQGWLGWLQAELSERQWQVQAPHLLPLDGRPQMTVWQQQLDQLKAHLTPTTDVIAHSLGCWLTMRLLQNLALDQRVGRVYLVAGFADTPRPEAIHFFSPEPDWVRLKQVAQSWHCIYSDDDHIVTPDRTRRLAHQLVAELICYPGHGHFLGSRGMKTFPALLELLIHPTE